MDDEQKKVTPAVPWPPDVRQLSGDEAWTVIAEGSHAEVPSMKVDSALMGLIEKGIAVVGLDDSNVLCIQATVWALEHADDE